MSGEHRRTSPPSRRRRRSSRRSLQTEIAAVEAAHGSPADAIETISLKPKRTGVQVKLVALTWVAQ